MQQNPFQWEHPKAMLYNDTIRKRIAGYELLFDLNLDIISAEQLHENNRVLLVGAGGGQEICAFSKKFPKNHYIAVDPSENMLELAKIRLQHEQLSPSLEIFADQLQNIQFEEPFNIATCHLVLHFIEHLEDKKSLLNSIANNLQPGALFFISSINADTASPNHQQLMSYWQHTMLNNGITEREWNHFVASFDDTLHAIPLDQLIELLQEAGFTNITPYFKTHLVDGLMMIKK